MAGPLAGIRVIELAFWLNGPAAGYMLADLGAEVIKIEEPGRGEPSRRSTHSYGQEISLSGGRNVDFEAPNRGKKSITLDLKQEKGRQALYRLVAKSDVFFTNLHKSVQARLGADFAALSRYNPRLIYAYNGSYGSLGPDGERRCFDSLMQARTGFITALVGKEGEPFDLPGAIFDQAGATMLAYGILAALLARERSGVSQELEVSLLSSAIHLQAYHINRVLWQGQSFTPFPRQKLHPLRTYYRCADGRWLHFAEPDVELHWQEFCHALGMEELGRDHRRATPELIPLLDQVFATRAREEWLKVFQEERCSFAYGPVNSMEELAQDPQVIANEYLVDFSHPTLGQTKTVGFPVKFSKTPCQIGPAPPELGEHTEEVLREVGGFSSQELGRLRAEGVI